MKRAVTVCIVVALSAPILSACSGDPFGPAEAQVDDLRLEWTLSTNSIERQEGLVATLRIRNMGAEAVQLWSPCTALALVRTFGNGEVIGLEGSGGGCRAMPTTYDVDAGATFEQSWEILAVRRDGLPVDRTTYRVQVELLPSGLPLLEASFRVR